MKKTNFLKNLKKRKNKLLKKYPGEIALIGLLSNFGIAAFSVIVAALILILTNINPKNPFLIIPILYTIFSAGLFFTIKSSKTFKFGYITGFILMINILIKFVFKGYFLCIK